MTATAIGESEDQVNDDGGPAFPYERGLDRGMSLRDYFAGQAVAGLCADPESGGTEATARTAYEVADAMLAERKKERQR